MGFLAHLVACVTAASPAWVVVPADAEEPSALVASAVAGALSRGARTAELVEARHEARQCAAAPAAEQTACFHRVLPGARVLVVSGVALRDRLALTVIVLARDGSVLAEDGGRGPASELEAMTQATLTRLTPSLEAREVPDAPVAVALVPSPEPPAVVVVAPPVRSRAPAWVATGATAVLAAVAISCLAVGLSEKSKLDAVQPFELRHSQAAALERDANTNLSVALGTGLGAVAGGVVAGVLWATP